MTRTWDPEKLDALQAELERRVQEWMYAGNRNREDAELLGYWLMRLRECSTKLPEVRS